MQNCDFGRWIYTTRQRDINWDTDERARESAFWRNSQKFPYQGTFCLEFPAINIKPMLFSQIFPPSPSPTESIRLFYTSVVSFAVSYTGRMTLKHVKYHVWNELPVQVRCRILDAWGWCTGTTQRDGMGREEGSGWGTHVYLWRIHFDIWQN